MYVCVCRLQRDGYFSFLFAHISVLFTHFSEILQEISRGSRNKGSCLVQNERYVKYSVFRCRPPFCSGDANKPLTIRLMFYNVEDSAVLGTVRFLLVCAASLLSIMCVFWGRQILTVRHIDPHGDQVLAGTGDTSDLHPDTHRRTEQDTFALLNIQYWVYMFVWVFVTDR